MYLSILIVYTGVKSVYDSGCIPPFFAAACELGLGFIPVVGKIK